MRVLLPAAIDTKCSTEGWAVLRGGSYPPEVVAFCWSEEHAHAIYLALNKITDADPLWARPHNGVYLAAAHLTDDDR